MNKKSVSPLIASILLIALTVSIGAMIIGWGRQYVQQRTSCLGYSIQILNAPDSDPSDNEIVLNIENTGTASLTYSDLKNKLRFIQVLDNGEIHPSPWYNSTDATSASVSYYMTLTEQDGTTEVNSVKPGDVVQARIKVYGNIVQGYFDIKGCGKVSNDWYKI